MATASPLTRLEMSGLIGMLFRGGRAMRMLAVVTLAATALVVMPATPALAHTTSIGYENAGPGSITFWFGSYHTGTSFTEGSFNIVGINGNTYPSSTVSFNLVSHTKPAGLVDCDTNYYASYSTGLSCTESISTVTVWQGVTFNGLQPGDYQFSYIPQQYPTQNWAPINSSIQSSTLSITGEQLGLTTAKAGPDQSVFVSQTVTLDGSQSTDSEGDPLAYSWTQTAGTPVTLSDPTAVQPTFTAPAVAGATLTFDLMVAAGPRSDTDSVDISVLSLPPTADAGGPYSGNEGAAITLSGASAADPEGDTLALAWTVDSAGCAFSDASALNPDLTCNDDGTYTATLSVTDSTSPPSVTSQATVIVSNVAPTATFVDNGPVDEGASFTLSLTNPSDPSTADTSAGFTHRFDCGDGLGFSAWASTNTRSCPTTDNAARSVAGEIRDPDLDATGSTGSVVVGNVAPVVDAGADQSADEDVEVSLDPSTFTDAGTADTHTATVDWGDGTAIEAGTVTAGGVVSGGGTVYVVQIDGRVVSVDPTTGAQTLVSSGAVVGSGYGLALDEATNELFVADWSGRVYQVDIATGTETLLASGGLLAGTWGIAVEASGDIVTANRHGSGGVVRIDRTTGAQSLVASISGLYAGLAVEADGHILVASDSSQSILRVDPVSGATSTLATGILSGGGLTVDASGDVFVVERGRSGQITQIDPETGATTVVSPGSSLVSGCSYGLAAGSGELYTTEYCSGLLAATDASDGTQTLVTSGDNITSYGPLSVATVSGSNGPGTVDGSHTYDDGGVYTVEVCAVDDDGGIGCDTLTMSINSLNDPPTTDAGGPYSGNEGSPISLSGAAVSDPDGDALTLLWTVDSPACAFSDASALNPELTCDDEGSATVTLSADDGTAAPVTNDAAVTVSNVAPTGVDDADVTDEESSVTTVNVLFNDTDPGLDTLSVSSADATSTSGGTVTDNGDGTFEYDPNGQFEGLAAGQSTTDTFSYTVTDGDGGFDTATVTMTVNGVNDAPTASATGDTVDEDGTATVSLTIGDPDGDDPLDVDVDWGEGPVQSYSLSAGVHDLTHKYLDDNPTGTASDDYTVAIDVSDGSATASTSATVTVDNVDPVLLGGGGVADLNTWTAEGGSSNWQVSALGDTVVQTVNGNATVFYSDFDVFGKALAGKAKVETSGDDDFFGFVIGFAPGDLTNPASDFLLVDWKQLDQSGAPRGLAVSRVKGAGSLGAYGHYWNHNGPVTELQRAATLGSTGWGDFVEYDFDFEYDAARLKVFVNGTLELDVAAPGGDPFPDGRLGFYNLSQGNVRYTGLSISGILGDEGSPIAVGRTLTDVGTEDTHTGSVAWGDSTSSAATIGAGTLSASHTYDDNGTYSVAISLTDDDTGAAGETIDAVIRNVAPTATFGNDGPVNEGSGFTLDLSGPSDPSVADTTAGFQYRFDCGDGSGFGAWSTSSSQVCSTDDNGTRNVAGEIRDKDLGSTGYTDTVTIDNVAPTATFSDDGPVNEGSGFTIDLTGPSDPSVADTTAGFQYRFDCGDGAGFGAWSASSSQVCSTDDNGTRNVAGEIRDKDLGTTGYASTVGVDNVAPSVGAGEDQATDEGTSVALAPATFGDVGSADTHTATVDWGDGTAVEVGSATAGGTVDGSHTYADDGAYIVTVCVEDDDLAETCDVLTVTVGNVVPVVEPGADQGTDEGTSISLDPASFSDAGTADTHTATIDWGDGSALAVGSVSESPSGPPGSTTPAVGTVDGSHAYDDNGAYTVTVCVTDDDAGQACDTLTVTVDNVAPTVTLTGSTTANESETHSYAFTATDPGDDTFALDAQTCGTAGSLSNATFDPATGAGSFDCLFPDGPASSVAAVTISDDDGGVSNTSTVTVEIANVAPTVGADSANIQVDEGSSTANSGTFGDVGDDTVAITVSIGDVTQNDDDGTWAWTHTPADGPDDSQTVTVTATDSDGAVTTTTFDLIVDNVAPSVDAGADQSTWFGDTVTLDASFDDPGPDAPWTAVVDWGDGSPADVTSHSATGAVAGSHVYLSLGDQTVEVCVTDADGAETCDTMTVSMDDLRARKQAVRDELAGMSTGDKKDDKRIEKAVEDLDQSLEADLWVDGNHLDPKHGDRVLKDERQAVMDLEKVESVDMSDAIAELVRIDRTLALIEIVEATAQIAASNGDAKYLRKAEDNLADAEEHFLEGDAEDAGGDPVKAIQEYRKAWDDALKAKKDEAKAADKAS